MIRKSVKLLVETGSAIHDEHALDLKEAMQIA